VRVFWLSVQVQSIFLKATKLSGEAMNLDDLIIAAFCQIDDAMNAFLLRLSNKPRLRERGALPTLCDSEVLCMEVIGAYLGLQQDQAIYDHFVRHYAHFFPGLLKVHRTTSFARPPTCRISKNSFGSTGSKTRPTTEIWA
jgi:hypothetical protein